MTQFRLIFRFLTMLCVALTLGACNDTESYADLLQKERKACNAYLANMRVENEIPADNNFEVGEDAPFYRIDEEGNLYMQVLDAGDPEDKAEYDDLIYFRFMRLDLVTWWQTGNETWDGNADNMVVSPTNFRFQNYSLSSTSQYGAGIQYPLLYLGVGCHVNLLVKSQYGFTEEIAYVTPFVYNIRYFRPQT